MYQWNHTYFYVVGIFWSLPDGGDRALVAPHEPDVERALASFMGFDTGWDLVGNCIRPWANGFLKSESVIGVVRACISIIMGDLDTLT
jgi:hypothetical protein